MTSFTDQQVSHALALIRAADADERRIENLRQLIDAAIIVACTNEQSRNNAVDYWNHPNHLADLIPMLRRNPPGAASHAVVRYHLLLDNLIYPPLGGPPRKIDMNALRREARPYLLGPYLGLTIGGVYPRLCTDHSHPTHGSLTYLTTGGPADPLLWQPYTAKISAWLGGHWTVTRTSATTITLTRQTPLPDIIPFNPAWLKADHLFLGINVATQRPHYVPIADLAHTLITGTTGMGKSVALHALMHSLLANMNRIDHVYAVCGSGGIAFNRYRGRHPKLTALSQPQDLWRICAKLVETMQTREAHLAASNRDKLTSNFIFLIVDEFPAFASPDNPDKKSDDFKAHQAFIGHIMALGRRARKAGIRLVFTVQEPTERDISSGVRSVLPGVLAFRTPLVAHATSLFGELTSLPADPRTLPRGRALYRDGTSGELVEVQLPVIAPTKQRGRP